MVDCELVDRHDVRVLELSRDLRLGDETVSIERFTGQVLVESLQRDWDANRKIWVISNYNSDVTHSSLVHWSAANVDDTKEMLRELSKFTEQPMEPCDITLVIDDATILLKEIDVLTEVEFLAEQSPSWLKLRLAIGSTLRWGVAGSSILYDNLIKDAKEMV